jgi:ATP phosphoribosyltransferase regulatory subunit
LGLQGVSAIIGEAGLTRSLLEPFPQPLQESVRRAISHLDRVALETLPLSPELRQHALFLFDLRGRPQDVLQQLAHLDLDPQARNALENLKALFELLDDHRREIGLDADSEPPTSILDSLVLDLSLIQTLDYYTGIVFEVVGKTESGTRILGQGGRYDRLLSLYHPQGEAFPGIGFALNLEDLQQALQSSGQLPTHTPPSDWLVVPKTPQSQAATLAYAQKLRTSAQVVRVEVALGDHQTPETVRDYAQRRQIAQIAWVNADGLSEIETL